MPYIAFSNMKTTATSTIICSLAPPLCLVGMMKHRCSDRIKTAI